MAKVYSSPDAALAEQRRVERILVNQVLPQAHYESGTRLARKASQKGPVDTGHYRHGWEVRRQLRSAPKGGGYTVSVVNTTPYSGVIEAGARPFWPPLAPLIEWARRKAGALALAGLFKISSKSFTARKDGSLRFRGSASLNTEDDAAVVAFARGVQRKIAAKGLPARWTMRKLQPFAVRALDHALKRRLRELAAQGWL